MAAIFEQFSIHYGAARMAAHWRGVDPEKAKEHWAKRLINMPRRNLGYALRHLPNNPPNVDEFAAIARRCPPEFFKALPHYMTPEQREEGRSKLEQIKAKFFSRGAEA